MADPVHGDAKASSCFHLKEYEFQFTTGTGIFIGWS